MTRPASVIYLPPGVVPAATAPAPSSGGVPFDRPFFEQLLPQAVASFCQQIDCGNPRVEVYTVDGAVHYVNALSGVTDNWVALQATRDDHPHPIQVFIPYVSVYRVEIHAEADDDRHHLGFVAPTEAKAPPAVQPKGVAAKLGAAKDGKDGKRGKK